MRLNITRTCVVKVIASHTHTMWTQFKVYSLWTIRLPVVWIFRKILFYFFFFYLISKNLSSALCVNIFNYLFLDIHWCLTTKLRLRNVVHVISICGDMGDAALWVIGEVIAKKLNNIFKYFDLFNLLMQYCKATARCLICFAYVRYVGT